VLPVFTGAGGRIPSPNVVRVALDTVYNRVQGNRRASRNGRVSSSPTRNRSRHDSRLFDRLKCPNLLPDTSGCGRAVCTHLTARSVTTQLHNVQGLVFPNVTIRDLFGRCPDVPEARAYSSTPPSAVPTASIAPSGATWKRGFNTGPTNQINRGFEKGPYNSTEVWQGSLQFNRGLARVLKIQQAGTHGQRGGGSSSRRSGAAVGSGQPMSDFPKPI
jgi:hypothetical protein